VRAAAPPLRRRRTAAIPGILASLLCGAAQAQWSGSVGIDSDYRFRGVSLGASKPAVRFAVNHDAPGGWYGGASATESKVSPSGSYAQLLGYVGRVTPLAGAALDLGATGSAFFGDSRRDFGEAYAGLIFQGGSVRANYSPSYFGGHQQTLYLQANSQLPLRSGWRLLGHLGALVPLTTSRSVLPHTSRVRADLLAGVGWSANELELTLAWTGATSGGPPPASQAMRRGGWVLGATWFF